MVRYMIRFCYLGTKYRGVQAMPTLPGQTIQCVLNAALESLEPRNEPKTAISSRTDAGVHALMNALVVDLEHKQTGETFRPHIVTDSLNLYLKENNHDIRIIKTCIVPDNFNARYSAKWRSYIYRLAILKPEIASFVQNTNYEEFLPIAEVNRCHIVLPLHVRRIQEAVKFFVGTHDFTLFTRGLKKEPWKNPFRTVYEFQFNRACNQSFISDPQYQNVDMWEFYIRGQSFLHHQVRKIVGTLLSLGYGYFSLHDIKDMIESPASKKQKTEKLPPPYGLFLTDVHFDKKDFEMCDENGNLSDSKTSEIVSNEEKKKDYLVNFCNVLRTMSM